MNKDRQHIQRDIEHVTVLIMNTMKLYYNNDINNGARCSESLGRIARADSSKTDGPKLSQSSSNLRRVSNTWRDFHSCLE